MLALYLGISTLNARLVFSYLHCDFTSMGWRWCDCTMLSIFEQGLTALAFIKRKPYEECQADQLWKYFRSDAAIYAVYAVYMQQITQQ